MATTDIRITGFGGQGVILCGYIIGKAASIFNGQHATLTQSFGPEARGSAIICEEEDPRLETALVAGGLAAGIIAGATAEGTARPIGLSRWVAASRSIARRGIRVDGGRTGWRRGSASQ